MGRWNAPVADTTNRVSPDGTTNPNLAQPPDPLNDPANATVAAQRAEAVAAAKDADAIVVAVGESPYAEGQGDDATPALPLAQAALIDALKATGKPVVVVVVAGRPLKMDRQLDESNASLMAFLPGSEGGAAVADALFGKVNPSGRLPVSWPKDSSSLPLAYNEPGKAYDPRYPFGYGLSYTRFKLSDLRAPWHADAGRRITASVDVANVGRSWGANTVLAFLVSGDGSRRLVAFERVAAGPHRRDTARLTFSAPAGSYRLVVGDLSRPIRVG
jgi:beta-glucosidase